MTDETFIIGTKGIDEETPEPPEQVWICNACGERTCVERGDRPTECIKVKNLPTSNWKEDPQ